MSSSIEWLARPGTKPETWNPVTGCTKVSAGCKHCYAEAVAGRFWAKQYPAVVDPMPDSARAFYEERNNGAVADAIEKRPRRFTDVMCHEDRLALPLKWRTRRTCFVNSMSDLFHEAVPNEFILNVFAVMAVASEHTFIVLTKRPERMRALLGAWRADEPAEIHSWPLPNVWLGVSVEDQPTADQRIPLLLQTPAAVRVVSYEPALGPVDWMRGEHHGPARVACLDWVIVGGESGPKARPCDVAWIRSTVQQCREAHVPAFVKQLGANAVALCGQCGRWIGRHKQGGFVDACGPTHAALIAEMSAAKACKGNDPTEWPEDLRVREWPEVCR